MTAPQITKVLNPPLISDSVEDFNVKAFQTVADLNPMMAEANAVASYINTKSSEVAANVATAAGAADAANTATTKAAEAAASALAADASKTAAATSATSAADSASTATTQATAAGSSATAAASSATSANTAKTAAETAATNAGNSATAAATSATTADTAATNAGNSATAAATSATSANTAKTAAETAATNAGNSATAAATSATNAGTSATNAATSASTANTKAGEAATSATAAASSATTASTKAGEAATSASAAASSASTASTAATNAGNSASAASTAATNAGNSATAAAGSASTASTKANEASTSASNAATSETNAASSAAAAAQSAQDAADIVVGDVMSDVTPQALGTAAPGTGLKASREDHVHQMPSAADVGAEPAFAAGTTAQYRRGDKTWQALNKSAVGLGNVDNTSDAAKPVSTATQTALNAKADLVGGKVPEAQLPAIAITDVFSVASQSAMLALAAERGDIAVRSDIDCTFVLAAEPASTLANWVQLRTPTDAVLSVAGKTGAVTLSKSDVGLSNVDNTADANKPVATDSVNGLMSAADKTKLNGIASNATANATDAQLRDRATHTGTQAQSTVTNLTTDLAARVNRLDNYATVTSGVIDLGLETELYHMTVAGNVTVSVSNAPTTARVVKRLLVQYSSGVVTWPASFKLPTPMPTFAAGKAYVFSIEQSPNSGVYFLVPGPEYTYP